MPAPSPLASLVATLSKVCQSAQQNHALLLKSEAATRAALVDPILRALGWDTADVQMVEPEKTINTAWRADYALHDAAGKIELLIEAKCLGSNLEKYSVVQQLLSYSFGFGIPKVIITDGLVWHFYNDFKPGNAMADSHFNLLRDSVAACASQLVKWLDTAHFGFGLPATTYSPPQVVASIPALTQPQPTDATKKLNAPSEVSAGLFTDLTQLNTMSLSPGQKPKQLRLPDGSTRPIITWKDILLETCQFLLQHHTGLSIPLPDKAGKKRFLLSTTKPAVGSSTLASYKSKAVFIYTHYSAADCIANALHAAAQLPASYQKNPLAISF
jgi:hypothetical protein